MRVHRRCGGLRRIVAPHSKDDHTTLRTTALAAACAAGLLAVPARASAAQSTVIAGPLKVKDYSMTICGTTARAPSA